MAARSRPERDRALPLRMLGVRGSSPNLVLPRERAVNLKNDFLCDLRPASELSGWSRKPNDHLLGYWRQLFMRRQFLGFTQKS